MDFSDLGIHFKGCDKTITMVQLKTILNHYGKKFTSKDKKPELCKMVEDVIKKVGSKGPAAVAAAAALHQQGQVQKQAPAAKANYCKLNEKKTGCVKAKTAAQNDTSCMYKQSTKRCTKAVAPKPAPKAPKVAAAPKAPKVAPAPKAPKVAPEPKAPKVAAAPKAAAKVAKKPQQAPAKFCKLNDNKSACLLTKNAAQNDASCNYNGKRCVKAKAAAAPAPKTPQAQALKPKTPQAQVQAPKPKTPQAQAQAPKPKTPQAQAQAPKPKTPQAQAPKPKTPQAQAPAKQLTKDEVIAKIKQCLGIAK